MIRRPPRSTRTSSLFPYTTLFRSQVTQYVFCLNTSAGHAARCEGDRDRLAITDEGRPSAQPRLLEAGVVECDKGAGGGVFDGWSGKRPGYGRAQADVAPAHVREQRLGLQQDRVRSEERRVGKEWVSTGRSRCSPDH